MVDAGWDLWLMGFMVEFSSCVIRQGFRMRQAEHQARTAFSLLCNPRLVLSAGASRRRGRGGAGGEGGEEGG